MNEKLDKQWPTGELAREKAKSLMLHGRVILLVTAIEESIASIEVGMTHGAIVTLKEALIDDKDFYKD